MEKYDYIIGQRPLEAHDIPEDENHAAAIEAAVASGKQIDTNGYKVYADGYFIARLAREVKEMEKNQNLGFLGLPDIEELDLGADGDFRPDEKVIPDPGYGTVHSGMWRRVGAEEWIPATLSILWDNDGKGWEDWMLEDFSE